MWVPLQPLSVRGTCRPPPPPTPRGRPQSLTKDGRDRSLDYKLSGFHVPPGCWDAQVPGRAQDRGAPECTREGDAPRRWPGCNRSARPPPRPPRRQVIDELSPGDDEVVLPKTTSSVFGSTMLHYSERAGP
jgi:ureidoacrylate peracid hydrolase